MLLPSHAISAVIPVDQWGGELEMHLDRLWSRAEAAVRQFGYGDVIGANE